MAGGAIVKWGDIEFRAIGPVGWTFVTGTRPSQALIEITDDLIPKFTPLLGSEGRTLTIEAPGHPKIEVRDIYALDIRAGRLPYLAVVRLSDSRWLWPRVAVFGNYNIPRRSGDTRIVSFTRVENITLKVDYIFAKWSLKPDGKPFSAVDMLTDILKKMKKTDDKVPDYRFFLGGMVLSQVIPQGINIAASGERALDIALAHVAGVGITLDKEGKIVIFSTIGQAELVLMERMSKLTIDGAGHIRKLERSKLRPREIKVYFAREIELRFDYLISDAIATVDRDDPIEPPLLENVLPQPDLELDNYPDRQRRTQGTWVNIEDYLKAIEGLEQGTIAGGGGLGPLNDLKVRTMYMGLWYAVERDYTTTMVGAVDQLWVARVAAIREHWRKTFRITPRWRDRISSMKPYLVSLLDPETGARGPSPVFTNYVTKPSNFSMSQAAGAASQNNFDVGRQVKGWSRVLSDAKIAPATVSVIDSDAGVFSFAFKSDPWGESEGHAPGNVVKMPAFKVTGSFNKDALGQTLVLWSTAALISEFQAAFILSVIQAAPNNKSRYQEVIVSPSEAEQSASLTIGDCFGPPVEIFVPEYIQTCRVGWLDSKSTEILAAFFDETGSVSIPEDLIVNKAEIRGIAEAFAAQEWVSLLDHADGEAAYPITPDIEIDGAVQSISHTIDPNGLAITKITMGTDHITIPREAFVPEGIQAVVRRLTQQ